MPVIRLPDPLRRYAGGAASFTVAGGTVEEALAEAFRLHPDLRVRLVDEAGRIRRHLVGFRNEQELSRESAEEATLVPDDVLVFVEAIGGGAAESHGADARLPGRVRGREAGR